jgi:folate-binding protein YgfZ
MNYPEKASFLASLPAAWLRVTGPDAPGFLQGQFSNDLRAAEEGASVYGLWLDHKGRIRADGFVLPRGDGFWIASSTCPGEQIRRHLEASIVADEVWVEDRTAGWAGVSLVGAGTGAWLASEPRPGVVFPGRRSRSENWEWVFPAEASDAVRASLAGAREESAAAAEFRRISEGIPSVPADAGPADLPQEAGLEADAVSTDKGCYLGQEVMARLKTRGRVRRRLARVAGPGDPPAGRAPLWQDGREVGELRTSAASGSGGFVGLAMLTLAGLRTDAPLSIGPEGEPSLRLA